MTPTESIILTFLLGCALVCISAAGRAAWRDVMRWARGGR